MPSAEKMLRKQLEEELGVDLSSKKALIRQEVGLAAVGCALLQPALQQQSIDFEKVSLPGS